MFREHNSLPKMEVDICDNQKTLEDFILENSPNDSYQYFKLPKWRNLISGYYGFRCFNLVVKDKNLILAFFPLFLVKSKVFGNHLIAAPFTGHGGDVVVKKGMEIDPCLKLIFKKIKDLALENKVKYLQIRGPKEENIGSFLSNGCQEPLKDFNFFLDLSMGVEKIRKALDKKLRNRLKKAEDSHIEIIEEANENGVRELYKLHLKTMKRLGTPPKSKNFFLELLKSGDYKIYLAKSEEKTIAASTFIVNKDYATWYDGVSLEEYKNLNATTLILWEFIKRNIKNIKTLDFGVSREFSSNYSYKQNWHPKIVRASKLYYYFDGKNEVIDVRDKKYSALSFVWKNLVPTFIAKYIGPIIRRSMGS